MIPQQHSWGRFRISQEDLERILSSHQVFAPFLNVLGGFGSKVKEDDYLDPCYQDYVCGTSDTERRFASYGPSFLLTRLLSCLIEVQKYAIKYRFSKETIEIAATRGLFDRPAFFKGFLLRQVKPRGFCFNYRSAPAMFSRTN